MIETVREQRGIPFFLSQTISLVRISRKNSKSEEIRVMQWKGLFMSHERNEQYWDCDIIYLNKMQHSLIYKVDLQDEMKHEVENTCVFSCSRAAEILRGMNISVL